MSLTYTVSNDAGTKTKKITRATLEQLRMAADWQLRYDGYCPTSVSLACLQAEADDAAALRARQDAATCAAIDAFLADMPA